jgi:pterin-4a-carbinolamine dehydratase
MRIYAKRASSRNHHSDLFDWYREHELRRTNHAARRIAGLSVHHAATIATHAGLDPESR